MDSTDKIAMLYQNFAILEESKNDILQHRNKYIQILGAVKGSGKEKRLAGQFITRFFKYFPDLEEKALSAQFDLCEDDDMNVRKQAIKDLPAYCAQNKRLTYRIADALTQLLQALDTSEFHAVQNSLTAVIKGDALAGITGMMNQIKHGDDGTREKGLKFLTYKMHALYDDIIACDVEDTLITELKKVYQDASSEEIPIIFNLLVMTKLGKSLTGNKDLVEFIADQMVLDTPSNSTDDEAFDRLTKSIKFALRFFRAEISSNRFVSFLCEHVLPKVRTMQGFDDGADNVLEILKLLAECTRFMGPLPCIEKDIIEIYNLLLDLMPIPDDKEQTQEPKLHFSYVECLLYTLHQFGRLNSNLFDDTTRLKAFRIRLQYFARALQGYIKTLRADLDRKSKDELSTPENKIKTRALKTTNNINTLIKDFFHTPPVYKSVVVLSWQTIKGLTRTVIFNDANGSTKRHTPSSFGSDGAPTKLVRFSGHMRAFERELYHPPNGKFSSHISPPTEDSRLFDVRIRDRVWARKPW